MNRTKTIFLSSAFLTTFSYSLTASAAQLEINTTGLGEVESASIDSDANRDSNDIYNYLLSGNFTLDSQFQNSRSQ